jgi:hypothetical protein
MLFDFLLGMGNYEDRCVGRWDNATGDQMVSTAEVTDGREPYETAFMHPDYNDGKIVIVEAYPTREAAAAGHARWVAVMTDGPLPDVLIDCANAEIGALCRDLGGQMRFPR